MTEHDLFVAALGIEAPADRPAYLDRACAGDKPLRRRVEALLRAHAQAGDFLVTPAAAEIANPAGPFAADTLTGPAAPDGGDGLDFLEPSDSPESLGRLGHYEVQEVVGRGGMGVVLKAFDEQLHRVVAIKVMARQLAASATARRRFTREARAAAAVTHDHVVTIHAVEDAGPRPYIVMQYVSGASLQDRIDRIGPLQLPELLRIGMQTASGLAAAHAQGLVHRDVKPSNILLENGVERVKITDFGLARAADDASLTQAGVVAGTPAFMSPEQAEGKPVDLRSDLFSLGSVLYAMCTGRPPFRAGSSMGVLKRVCETMPTPVREVSPNVPEWLVAVIDKLHAKDPASRFQSAAEVAEVFGRHLADLQRPSVASMPAFAPRARRRRWAVTATAILCLVAGLGVTEATGVTKVRTVVMRVFTPEGTQDLHVIGEADPLVAANRELGAFILLGGKGVEVRKFDTLAEAVQGASNGDTIEIRGNGPFVSAPINLGTQALTMRAGEGFRPVVRLGSEGKQTELPLLKASGPLVLEGIEWQHPGGPHDPPRMKCIVSILGPAVHIANCRFVMAPGGGQMCVYSEAAVGSFRNCEFLSPGVGVWGLQPSNQVQVLDNCLHLGTNSLRNVYAGSHSATASIHLTRNTIVTDQVAMGIEVVVLPEPSGTAPSPIQMDVSSTIFDGPSALSVAMPGKVLSQETLVKPGYVEGHLRRMIVWRDQENLYAGTCPTLLFWAPDRANSAPGLPRSLAEWKRFWGSSDAACAEGRVRYQGGNLFARLAETPDQLRPADFRLRSDSAGYRAGKDGKDLGADVDLVGPGPAYDRWKKTPAYQQWLKETGQLRAEAPKPEPGAFAILGGKGVAERKFDTLTEAVNGASDGDTIEVRGNGPFITEPVDVHSRTLTIRAGHGARPVIRLSPQASQAFEPMLSARGEALVLEGLEFQRLGQREWTAGEKAPYIVATRTAALHIANCRFRLSGARYSVCVNCYAPVRLRNCEFLGFAYGVEGGGVTDRLRVLENCVYVGGVPLTVPPSAEVRLTRNTLVSPDHLLMLPVQFPPEELEKTWGTGPARIEASANVLDGRVLLAFLHHPASFAGGAAPKPADAEAMLHRMLAWRDRGNLYREGSTSVNWCVESLIAKAVFPLAGKSAADWKRFWNDPQAELTEGRIRYQGGDLLTRAATAPDQLTPEDLRLRRDSAGYRAGKDGKNLGADVDLVGPGKGYERWKATPEYQQWLKETGQLRAETPKPELAAFTLLGGKGVAERKFDTLADAVLGANDGDTIEIRGNGPFVSDGVTTRHPLVIRAGTGYTPSITLSKTSADKNIPLLSSLDALVLEGLELKRSGGAAAQVEGRYPTLLAAWERGSLHVANCRLIYEGDSPHWEQGALFASNGKSLSVRNSVLSGNISTESGGFCTSGGRYDIDNCVCAIGGIGFSIHDPDARDVAIRIRGNTLVGNCLNLTLFTKPNLPTADDATPPIHLGCCRNVARWDETTRNKGLLYFHQAQKEPFAAAQAEALLPRLVRLDEKQNVYRTGTPMLQFVADWQSLGSKRGQDLADWDRFWGHKNTGSVEGEIRFQGGDLVTRARSAPEQLTAEDFRLRPDSAGYRAGKDGKDLGADVDLVGPGPAYERWKNTPVYQQWLKDSGQVTK